MPLVVLGATEGWRLSVQLTNTTFLIAAPSDKIRYAGPLAGDPIVGFQDSTHLLNVSNVHRCASTHANNTKYTGSATATVNGLGVSLPLTTAQVPFLFTLYSLEEVAISGAQFYVYSGTDATPVGGTFYAAEVADTIWTSVNGSGSALALNAQLTPAVDHDFWIGTSFSPTGSQTGTMKISATYV